MERGEAISGALESQRNAHGLHRRLALAGGVGNAPSTWIPRQILNTVVAIPVTFDDHRCKRIASHQLPTGLGLGHPIPSSTRDIGSAWAQSKASPVLAVPSAVVPIETNFLLNPLMPNSRKFASAARKLLPMILGLLRNRNSPCIRSQSPSHCSEPPPNR